MATFTASNEGKVRVRVIDNCRTNHYREEGYVQGYVCGTTGSTAFAIVLFADGSFERLGLGQIKGIFS